ANATVTTGAAESSGSATAAKAAPKAPSNQPTTKGDVGKGTEKGVRTFLEGAYFAMPMVAPSFVESGEKIYCCVVDMSVFIINMNIESSMNMKNSPTSTTQIYWLLDSGSSYHVVSQATLESGHVKVLSRKKRPKTVCQTATGDLVEVGSDTHATIEVNFLTTRHFEQRGGVLSTFACTCRLEAVVSSEIKHNLINLNLLCWRGWKPTLYRGLLTAERKEVTLLPAVFGDCTWLQSVMADSSAKLTLASVSSSCGLSSGSFRTMSMIFHSMGMIFHDNSMKQRMLNRVFCHMLARTLLGRVQLVGQSSCGSPGVQLVGQLPARVVKLLQSSAVDPSSSPLRSGTTSSDRGQWVQPVSVVQPACSDSEERLLGMHGRLVGRSVVHDGVCSSSDNVGEQRVSADRQGTSLSLKGLADEGQCEKGLDRPGGSNGDILRRGGRGATCPKGDGGEPRGPGQQLQLDPSLYCPRGEVVKPSGPEPQQPQLLRVLHDLRETRDGGSFDVRQPQSPHEVVDRQEPPWFEASTGQAFRSRKDRFDDLVSYAGLGRARDQEGEGASSPTGLVQQPTGEGGCPNFAARGRLGSHSQIQQCTSGNLGGTIRASASRVLPTQPEPRRVKARRRPWPDTLGVQQRSTQQLEGARALTPLSEGVAAQAVFGSPVKTPPGWTPPNSPTDSEDWGAWKPAQAGRGDLRPKTPPKSVDPKGLGSMMPKTPPKTAPLEALAEEDTEMAEDTGMEQEAPSPPNVSPSVPPPAPPPPPVSAPPTYSWVPRSYPPPGAVLSSPSGESLHTRMRLGICTEAEADSWRIAAEMATESRRVRPRTALPIPPPAPSASRPTSSPTGSVLGPPLAPPPAPPSGTWVINPPPLPPRRSSRSPTP
ncbi:GIP, partial [Symbiodinium sp. CCMP2592]